MCQRKSESAQEAGAIMLLHDRPRRHDLDEASMAVPASQSPVA
jgi:hypothetical protein